MKRSRMLVDRWLHLAARWFLPGEISEECNKWNLYREITWFGVLSAVSTTFVSVFTVRLGASSFLIGLLTSLPALINVLCQMPAARLVERAGHKQRILLIYGFLLRLPIFLMVLVPFLPADFRAAAVICMTALGTIPTAAGTIAFTSVFAEVIPAEDRPRVVSVRNALLAASTTVTLLVSGLVLDVLAFPLNYQLVFMVAFLTALVSLYYLARIVIPGDTSLRPAETRNPARMDVRRAAQRILSQRSFVRFTLGAFLYYWGLEFPIPLYPLYRVRTLGLSDGWIGALSMLESGVTILAYFAWGRMAQKRSSRFILLAGTLLVTLFPFVNALSRSPYPLLLASLSAGIAGPAFNLGLFNGLLEVAPAERRATYVGVFNTLINIAAFASPLLGTAAAEKLGIREALIAGGAIRVAGFLAMAYLLYGLELTRRIGRALRR